MALTERTEADQIEVVQGKFVQVRLATIIERDGVEVTRTYHRYVINPGDSYADVPQNVQDICAVVHTQAVVDAYQAEQAATEAEAQTAMESEQLTEE